MNKMKRISRDKALEILGGYPSSEEIQRLQEYYFSYGLHRRKGIINGFFENWTKEEILRYKFEEQGVDPANFLKQKKGGDYAWVGAKTRNLVFRLLYLRYRFDEEKTQIQANAKVRKVVTLENETISQSTVSKATKTDKKIDKNQ